MSELIDITGQRFGRLNVIGIWRRGGKQTPLWECKCDCGKTSYVRSADLRLGKVVSCGCYKNEQTVIRSTKHGNAKRLETSRLYNVWNGMKERCSEEKHISYKYYGGRGIRVCEEWQSDYMKFYEWSMKNGYDETAKRGECTLDRIDVNGNYSPENCRWVSMKIQQNNLRRNVHK